VAGSSTSYELSDVLRTRIEIMFGVGGYFDAGVCTQDGAV